MNFKDNEIILDHGVIGVVVNDGYGNHPSHVDFDLEFLWVSPKDYYKRVVKYETYESLEEAYKVYCELVKEVCLILEKEV